MQKKANRLQNLTKLKNLRKKRGEMMKLTEKVDLSRSEWERLIDDWIFDEEHRQMLKLNILDGKGYDYLSFKFNYSTRQVARILQKSKEKLFKHVK